MKMLISISCAMTVCISSSVFAEKFAISGEPVTLEPYAQIYKLPDNYNNTNPNYHYVTVEGENRVCYSQPNASLQSLNMKIITVHIEGQNVQWNCYDVGQATQTTQ